jgi:hypothetical protein
MPDKYVTVSGAGTNSGDSEANAYTWAQMLTFMNGLSAGGAAGYVVNVKAGSYGSFGANQAFTVNATVASRCILRGYSTTPGDGYIGRTFGGSGFLTTTNYPTLTFSSGFGISVPTAWTLENLNLVGTGNTNFVGISTDSEIRRCKVIYTGTGVSAIAVNLTATRAHAFENDIELVTNGTACIRMASANLPMRAIGNRCKSAADGISIGTGANGSYIGHNICYRCTSNGIFLSATSSSVVAWNNTLVLNGAAGINVNSHSLVTHTIYNNLITDNTGIAISPNAGFECYHNRSDRNSSNVTNDTFRLSNNATSVTQANEYVDAANNDFRLKSTSPAIAAGTSGVDVGALPAVISRETSAVF